MQLGRDPLEGQRDPGNQQTDASTGQPAVGRLRQIEYHDIQRSTVQPLFRNTLIAQRVTFSVATSQRRNVASN